MLSESISNDLPETVANGDLPRCALRNDHCRTVLQVLPSLPQPVPERVLATYVAAVQERTPTDEVTDADRSAIQTSLRHQALPRLDDAGLVAHDVSAGEVSMAERLDPTVFDLLDQWNRLDNRTLDALSAIQDNPQRKQILTVLEDRTDGLTRWELASELAETGHGHAAANEHAPPTVDDRKEALELELHHRHLPKLETAGLLSYDEQTGVVTPETDVHWEVFSI